MSSNAASKRAKTSHAEQQTGSSKPGAVGTTYDVLDHVNTPADMKTLSDNELIQLCDDVRNKTIAAVSQTGGHLGAGLGVVEITVAIHAIFNTPDDKLIFDVGHQCYPHKILTGRKDRIETLRQGGGLSGFTKRSESEYDPFGAAHSSTSISAGLGMAVARDLKEAENDVICVIGDSAMTGGMAFEAMNNAGMEKSRLIVILNDNDMSIAPPTGALNKYLSRLVSSKPYFDAREAGKKITNILPAPLRGAAKRAEESARTAIGKGTLFEELGFYYIGPVDGHDMNSLLPILRNIKDSEHRGPILIHAKTVKGRGYAPAEAASCKMHGVAKFDVVTGTQFKPKSAIPSYTKVFADYLTKEADKDDKVVAITAAMPDGTGLKSFAEKHPDRCFDVGIAEQHAVTFAGGLAAEGFKPFCAIYSTFLQRGYDQLIHDVALQNLPVRFAIDRAGYVGADGQTHAGSFDIAYLGCVPNMVLMAASDEAELAHMVHTAACYDDGPIAFRYPRGNGIGVNLPKTPKKLTIGKGRIVQNCKASKTNKGDIALLAYGCRLQECLSAAKDLTKQGYKVTVADARFAKPLDTTMIKKLVSTHKAIMTVEAGSIGGFGSYVLDYLANEGLLDGTCKIKTICMPDLYLDQDSQDEQYKQANLDASSIKNKAKALI